jgi:hypothetical protein
LKSTWLNGGYKSGSGSIVALFHILIIWRALDLSIATSPGIQLLKNAVYYTSDFRVPAIPADIIVELSATRVLGQG